MSLNQVQKFTLLPEPLSISAPQYHINFNIKNDFHYLHYGLKWKRIAIAFLKKNDQLMMGEAKQTLYLDIPFFAKDTPIKYDSVKFVFKKSNGPQKAP